MKDFQAFLKSLLSRKLVAVIGATILLCFKIIGEVTWASLVGVWIAATAFENTQAPKV